MRLHLLHAFEAFKSSDLQVLLTHSGSQMETPMMFMSPCMSIENLSVHLCNPDLLLTKSKDGKSSTMPDHLSTKTPQSLQGLEAYCHIGHDWSGPHVDAGACSWGMIRVQIRQV